MVVEVAELTSVSRLLEQNGLHARGDEWPLDQQSTMGAQVCTRVVEMARDVQRGSAETRERERRSG